MSEQQQFYPGDRVRDVNEVEGFVVQVIDQEVQVWYGQYAAPEWLQAGTLSLLGPLRPEPSAPFYYQAGVNQERDRIVRLLREIPMGGADIADAIERQPRLSFSDPVKDQIIVALEKWMETIGNWPAGSAAALALQATISALAAARGETLPQTPITG